ncbi:hypothetical protein N0V91_004532 [Didymella pomorum]|uniref:Actin-like ATPase domain-containing protein n=1 Tax=Didymella pomorum TaxID=749634 RepID=A0A9W8ZH52_9PLEO|nr:hypothetical protein N0V91_004532 [Didymella pomorum]
MGLFKKLTVRSKTKSTWDLTDEGTARPLTHQLDVPKQTTRPASFSHAPPPYELEAELGAEDDTDTGSILVGIDFGTTYSGVAWAYSKQPDEINIITNWDSAEYQAADKGKAPTRISYEPSAQIGDDYGPQYTWGYGVGDDEAVEWFKLLLLDDADMDDKQRNSPQIRKAKALLRKANKTPVQAVADYLRLLWAHAIANIEKAFGEAALEGLPYQVVCTVPAVWTTKAVNMMREAAKRAGILERRLAGETVLRFVSEPEAAALATFEDLKNRPNFQIGDSFVVCDAGGGTVDLISYKITRVKPMQLAECVEGSGKLCGAVFLDQDFEGLMQQWIGDAWDVPDSIIKTLMSSQWENGIKRGFDGKDRNWKITLPYECTMRGAPPYLDLSQGHVREIFDNVVSQVRILVNDQISAIEAKEDRLPKVDNPIRYDVNGDNIDEAKPVQLKWTINVSAEQFRSAYPLTASIFKCDDKEAPSRQTDSVRQSSEIKSEKHVDISSLSTFRGTDGKLYKRIDFAIEMSVIGTALEFALMYQGRKIGHSQVEPDVDDRSMNSWR